ncbi:hypothetical protein HanRHA438_Chr03g0136851 [Helianthus annuus]|nr:hypothetical protein HanRHA438_Chr03g0136851 [Helianthus annuus]
MCSRVVRFFVFDTALTTIVIVYFAEPVYIVCFVLWCSSTLTYTYFDVFDHIVACWILYVEVSYNWVMFWCSLLVVGVLMYNRSMTMTV